jgi:SAM-dependent methyltransferase
MTVLKRWFLGNPIFNFNVVERDRWVRAKAAAVPAGSKVLDLGAGSCPYRPYFRDCTYKTQDFIALSPEQLRDKHGYGQIDYVCDATAIPVDDGAFDVVLCTEVLEHVPNPAAVVAEICRVLRPGGTLLLTAPLGSGLHQTPFHFYGGYTPFWYRKVLSELGCESVEIEPNGGFFKHYGQETIRLAKLTAPFTLPAPLPFKLFWTPFWLLSLPWTLAICPLLAHYFDRFDQKKEFTIGYHVAATKAPARSATPAIVVQEEAVTSHL